MKQNKKNEQISIKKAFKKALNNFLSMTPMLLGVIGLVGIMQTFVTSDMLSNLFGYTVVTDLFTGTFIGAISSGNPAISYIISEGLLAEGVSLYAVSAFILGWVTLGIVQLPAEVSVFGYRFAFYKNLFTLLSTLMVAFLTVVTLEVFI
ncbi:MAG: permease [Campylobacterota bacterium]|nr:permease [Campylobacterota bacterium]